MIVNMYKTLVKSIRNVLETVCTILEIFRVFFTTSKKFPKLFNNNYTRLKTFQQHFYAFMVLQLRRKNSSMAQQCISCLIVNCFEGIMTCFLVP